MEQRSAAQATEYAVTGPLAASLKPRLRLPSSRANTHNHRQPHTAGTRIAPDRTPERKVSLLRARGSKRAVMRDPGGRVPSPTAPGWSAVSAWFLSSLKSCLVEGVHPEHFLSEWTSKQEALLKALSAPMYPKGRAAGTVGTGRAQDEADRGPALKHKGLQGTVGRREENPGLGGGRGQGTSRCHQGSHGWAENPRSVGGGGR